MKIFRFHKSFNSVVIGLVESGNFIPPEIATSMTQQAIDYRSAGQHLISLCECSQLRDAGLIATNVSTLVVDLTRPLPESPSDSSIASLYHQTTPVGQAVYEDAGHQLKTPDHQLRRDTFYLPFFQKINAELNRLVEEFGRATLLMMNCDSQLRGRTIDIAGEVSNHDFSGAIQAAEKMKIDVNVGPVTEQPLIDQRAASEQAKAYSLTLSPECLLDGGDWSDKKADQVREVLAEVVGEFSTNSKR